MQRRTLPISGAALAAMLATGAANAVPIHYFFHGTGEWTLNGIEAGGDFTSSLTGDTAGISFGGDEYVNRVSGTFSASGSAVAFTDSGQSTSTKLSTAPRRQGPCFSLKCFPALQPRLGRSRTPSLKPMISAMRFP